MAAHAAWPPGGLIPLAGGNHAQDPHAPRPSELIPNPDFLSPQVTPTAPSVFSVEANTPDVSSTDIRRRVGAGESIDGLVPSSVAGHIRRHRLYVPAPVAAVL